VTGIETSLYATVALAAGPWLFYRGFRTMSTRRLIANTPTARIRSMAMGLVEVSGKVEPRSTAVAPFSGKPCAYWEVDIASQTRRGWTIVHRNRSGNPFFLRDETGVALVYPNGSESKLRFGSEEHYQGLMLPSCYGDYMNTHVSALNQIARVGNLRFRERMLEAGEPVYVLGTATPRAQERTVADVELPTPSGSGDAAERLRTLDHEVTGVIRRGENEPTFIISQESEKALMLDLGGKAFLQLAGGPVLTLFGAIYWLAAMSSGRTPW
jgi:E3 ubiquitin ligase